MRNYLILLCCISPLSGFAQEIRTLGFKINITDESKALEFYCETLNFQVDTISGDVIVLKTPPGEPARVLLQKVANLLPESPLETRAGFTLQVNNLDSAIKDLKAKGVDFGNENKRKEGVGYAIYMEDPFGTRISLMHQTIIKVDPFQEPRIYNYGFAIPDMARAIEFYEKLGFVQRSQKYLPNDMPLGHGDNSFAFMLHQRHGIEAIRHNSTHSQHVVILFQTPDLQEAIDALKLRGVDFLQKEPVPGSLGKYISFYDPFGYLSDLVEVK